MEKMPISNNIRAGEPLTPGVKPRATGMDREKLRKACTDFEALFIQEILKFMRQTIPQSALSGPGAGKEVYQSLLDQELSKNLAKKGGLRIGEMVYRQMSRKEDASRISPGPLNPLLQGKNGPEEK
jgi:flagellar protein FlgJ